MIGVADHQSNWVEKEEDQGERIGEGGCGSEGLDSLANRRERDERIVVLVGGGDCFVLFIVDNVVMVVVVIA